MPETAKPAVGRVVHYVARGSADGVFPPACRAGIITEVEEVAPGMSVPGGQPTIGVVALNPTGLFFHPISAGGCSYDERPEDERQPGTWHWPERV